MIELLQNPTITLLIGLITGVILGLVLPKARERFIYPSANDKAIEQGIKRVIENQN